MLMMSLAREDFVRFVFMKWYFHVYHYSAHNLYDAILVLTQFAMLNRLGIFRKLHNSVFLFWNSDDEGKKFFPKSILHRIAWQVSEF